MIPSNCSLMKASYGSFLDSTSTIKNGELALSPSNVQGNITRKIAEQGSQ